MGESIRIMNVKINSITLKEAVDYARKFLAGKVARVIYTPNTEIVMEAQKDDLLMNILNDGDLIIPDGIGLVYASRIKKKALPERVTGFDLSVKLLELANEGDYRVYLLGGKPGVGQEANEKITKSYPNIQICGYHHGYFKGTHTGNMGHQEEQDVIEKINKANPDILFVGLGAPKQERWIHENKKQLKCKVIIGNGGTIDILAGRINRAPERFQKLGLEWLYRLMKEPKRIKRQLVLPRFMLKVLFSRNNIVK